MKCPNCDKRMIVKVHICQSCGYTLECHAPDDQMSESGKRLWAVVSAISTGTPRQDAVRAVYGTGVDDQPDE